MVNGVVVDVVNTDDTVIDEVPNTFSSKKSQIKIE